MDRCEGGGGGGGGRSLGKRRECEGRVRPWEDYGMTVPTLGLAGQIIHTVSVRESAPVRRNGGDFFVLFFYVSIRLECD